MSKTLMHSDKIVRSLQNLKEELYQRKNNDPIAREIFFKINSCLYDSYPVGDQMELPIGERK